MTDAEFRAIRDRIRSGTRKPQDVHALVQELERLRAGPNLGELRRLNQDLDAASKRLAKENADLVARVSGLEAALAEATKPAPVPAAPPAPAKSKKRKAKDE